MYNEDIEFEWDEAKRVVNVRKHGIDFERAKYIWRGWVMEAPSPQTHHGEQRFRAIGESEGRIIAVIFTWRANVRRIISARGARKNEKKDYENEIRRVRRERPH